MFVDDLLLFGKDPFRQMQKVRDVLEIFCGVSGQNISYGKSSTIFSRNTYPRMRKELMHVVGIRESTHIGLYLGVIPSIKCLKGNDHQHIIDKFKNKLSLWKTNIHHDLHNDV